ncbi:hypothetical protein [Baaleninema simplex]|uniref:hypothetical protein n=1 Tax=Baaleninema simplex TaxID=2862350 RepID=UPI000345187F|nr:hypothetical protein [Baaleninema simplex]
MSRQSKPGTTATIALYVAGFALVFVAIILLLKGIGLLGNLPNSILWAIGLFAAGAGILAGIANVTKRRR